MSYVSSYIIGAVLGFSYNFPPKKIQQLLLGISIVILILSFAILLDNKLPLFGKVEWLTFPFSFAGYITGFIGAKGLRRGLKVNWQ